MKKRAYSLTKKERKALQEAKSGKTKTEETPDPVVEPIVETEGDAAVAQAGIDRKAVIIIAAVVLAAVLLITAAIVIPVLFTTVYRYRNVNNPVARMELSNGMVLEYEIFEDTCPAAATNFIFLANIGYFDNTIIFDNQNNWVRFGGWETETKHRSTNTAFTDTVEGMDRYPKSKFGYRLKADTSAEAKMYNQRGILAFLYSDSATEFQVAAVDGAQLTIPTSSSNREYKVTACGRAFEESMEYIEQIAAMQQNPDSANPTWKAPYPTLTIKKVKIYNLNRKENRKKWNDFHFDTYFYGNNYISNWMNS